MAQTYDGPNNGSFSIANDWVGGVAPNSGSSPVVGPDEGSATAMTVFLNYDAATYTNNGEFNSLTIEAPSATQNITVSEDPFAGYVDSLQTYDLDISTRYGGGNGTFVQGGFSSSNNNIASDMVVGGVAGTTGEYDLDTNGTLYANEMFIGNGGTGIVRQNTGAVSGQEVNVSSGDGYGEYDLSGGTLNESGIAVGNQYDGDVGAEFNQTAGTSTTDTLTLWGNSSYTLNTTNGPSTLTVSGSGEYVGKSATSTQTETFTQTGGTHTVTGGLYVGYEAAGASTFTLNTGSLSADNEYIAYNSTGNANFVQSGGVNTDSGMLDIADGAYNGTYSIYSTATLSVTGVIGLAGQTLDGGNATFQQYGGAVSASALYFGYSYGSGQYVISAGSLSVGSISFSPAQVSGGEMTQTGGTVTVGSAASPGSIVMNCFEDFSSQYSLSSANGPSSLILYGNMELAGGNAPDTTMSFNQSGGTAQINGNVFLGDTLFFGNTPSQGNSISFTNSASCTVTGSVYIGGSASQALGQGTLTVNGGSLTVDGALQLWNTSGTSATLSSGTLEVGSLNVNSNPSLFNWTGGTLHVTNQTIYFDTITNDSNAPFGNSLTLGSTQSLIVDNGNIERLDGPGSSVTQNAGNNITNGLYVAGSNGAGTYNIYTLNSGALTVNGNTGGIEQIGFNAGNALFQQYGGTNTAQQLIVGLSSSSNGQFDLYGGSVNVTSLTLGYSSPAGSLYMTGGTLTATTTTNNGSIQQTGGVASLGKVNGTGAIQVGNFTSGSAHTTVVSISQSTAIVVSNGLLTISPNSGAANTLDSLTILGTGELDLNNNHMYIDYAGEADPIAQIAGYIRSGYNGGTWNGAGIISTTAQSNPQYGIGYADSADPNNPAGLLSGTIEIMYTLLGDANLDGKVNGTDFTLMAANFNDAVTDGWDKGDFNYDGKVNGSDFVLLAENFNQYASQSDIAAADLAALDSFAAANGISLANVPEPGTVGIVLVLAIAARRRRKLHVI